MIDSSYLIAAGIIVAAVVFFLTLIKTDLAIIFLIFAMLLSPEFALARLPGRSIVVRMDDILIVVMFLTWLAKLAVNKQLGFIRYTPLNAPLLLFIASCLVSTVYGILIGTVTKPLAGVFYVLKYIEYFLLYFMISNVVRTTEQFKRFIPAVLATAFIVCLYGYWQLMAYGTFYRITAPFEGIAEPNTLAGYLVLIMGLVLGLAIHAPSRPKVFLYLALLCFILPIFVLTYSRTGYVCFIIMYLIVCIVAKKHRVYLFSFLIIGLIIAPNVLPQSVFARIAATIDPTSNIEFGGIHLSQSPAARLLVWKYIGQHFLESPFLGFGVTGAGFLDSQYATVIGEQGVIGLLLFIWVRWRIFIHTLKNYLTSLDPMVQGVCLGFEISFIALLFFSITANVFVIVRVVEPFWFVAAMVMIVPMLDKDVDSRGRLASLDVWKVNRERA